MGGLSSAVLWWEESQMRVLVLSSLFIQFILFIFSYFRRSTLHRWLRSIMYLVFLGGDAVAIYALATLFNRHKDQQQQDRGGGGSSSLEVVWAPVLLMHLGGHDGITAYDIEDNELWSRHLLTAVSQVTVAIYVFYKSWPGNDERLLQAAILLFIIGVLKCFAKPLALKKASINSLVSSSTVTEKTVSKQNQGSDKICRLVDYVKEAKDFVDRQPGGSKNSSMQAQGDHPSSAPQGSDDVNPTQAHPRGWWQKTRADALYAEYYRELYKSAVKRLMGDLKRTKNALSGQYKGEVGLLDEYVENRARAPAEDKGRQQQQRRDRIMRCEAHRLFVDLLSPYPRRLCFLKYFWVLSQDDKQKKSYTSLRQGLAGAFCLLYTRLGFAGNLVAQSDSAEDSPSTWMVSFCAACIQGPRMVLPWAAIALFHWSHREAYTDIDVKITYAIFFCTAVLETYSGGALFLSDDYEDKEGSSHVTFLSRGQWPEMVAQYSLVGYVARNEEHRWMMRIVDWFGCKDLLDQHCHMRPCFSSHRITQLVLKYLKEGWQKQIQDAATYRRFNNNRGHWALKGKKHPLDLSIKRPFDESVLLWHIATDFCFFLSQFPDHRCDFAEIPSFARSVGLAQDTTPAQGSTSRCCVEMLACRAVQCRQMSNYMMYLLFVNPEMLLPGTRRNLFTTAYDELQEIRKTRLFNFINTYKVIKAKEQSPFAAAYKEIKDILMDNNQNVYKRVTTAIKGVNSILRDRNRNPIYQELRPEKGERLMGRAISTTMLKKSKKAESRKGYEEESMEGRKEESTVGSGKKFIDDAWTLAQGLLGLGDEGMWNVIEGVWVEMLCFSASRCRGYLHAKALGSGGEFLSYIWLLQFYMGTETFTERLEREEVIPREAAPSTSNTCATSSTSNISTLPSTSEIHAAGEDMV